MPTSAKPIKNYMDSALRADVLLARAYPAYSRAALAKLFSMGKITDNNKVIKPGDKIKPGAIITADISLLEKPIEDIEIPIIFEDNNVIVVDKPAGVISHARGRYWDEPSVASFVRQKVSGFSKEPAVPSVRTTERAGPPVCTPERAGIVHRLDRATSGVMICAKNPGTLSTLQKQFSNRMTKKTYYAIIVGNLEPSSALIDVPIGRNPKKPQTFRADKLGKQALTKYEVVKRNGVYTLIKLTPLTGRTHQLRVHLKHINRPILGDELYNGKAADRLYLHAYSLEISLPKGERKVFISKLPQSFEDKF